LNIENGIARLALGEDHLVLWVLHYGSAQPGLSEEILGIKYPSLKMRHTKSPLEA